MTSNWIRTYTKFIMRARRTDLRSFWLNHERLFRQAQADGDYTDVTRHYDALFGPTSADDYGQNFRLVPPFQHRQQRHDALSELLGRIIELGPGGVALDLGCEPGRAMCDIARDSGGRTVGVTLGADEVNRANDASRREGLGEVCVAMEGGFDELPFGDNYFDGAYAIYALKHFIDLEPLFREIARVLRPGGRVVIYDLLKTEAYDESVKLDRELFSRFEYGCGLPPIHTSLGSREMAEKAGLSLVSDYDLDQREPWYHYLVDSPAFRWLMWSRNVSRVIGLAESLRFVPCGFKDFSDVFLAGTVRAMVELGRRRILSGSRVLVFEKAGSPRS